MLEEIAGMLVLFDQEGVRVLIKYFAPLKDFNESALHARGAYIALESSVDSLAIIVDCVAVVNQRVRKDLELLSELADVGRKHVEDYALEMWEKTNSLDETQLNLATKIHDELKEIKRVSERYCAEK